LRLGIDVGPGDTIRFPLDADAVVILTWLPRQRITAQQSGGIRPRPQPQYNKLSRQGGRQRLPIGWLQYQRGHIAALAGLLRYPRRAKPGPRRRRAGRRREPRISRRCAAAPLSIKQCLEGGTPASAQRRDAQGALQLVARVTGQVQQGVDLGHGHGLGPLRDLGDLAAGSDLALFEDAEVEPGSAMRDQQGGHLRLVHADADPVAGDARLRHFEDGLPDPIPVTDAHFVVGEAVDGKVLPELPVSEVASPEATLPIAIGVNLINKDRAMFAAMPDQITLTVAIDVEPPHHPPALNGRLPDGGVNSLSLPRDVARQTHIDRKQACHPSSYAGTAALRNVTRADQFAELDAPN